MVGKIGLLAIVLRAANELNDLCAQENPSHTAIATRPTSESDIRYAAMLALAIVLVIARSKTTKQSSGQTRLWIASRSLSSGAQ
jgi:hypothetical protein